VRRAGGRSPLSRSPPSLCTSRLWRDRVGNDADPSPPLPVAIAFVVPVVMAPSLTALAAPSRLMRAAGAGGKLSSALGVFGAHGTLGGAARRRECDGGAVGDDGLWVSDSGPGPQW